MPETNVARDLLWPTDNNILVRIVFLYVGQGTSTIVLAAKGETYRSMLVDINLDAENGGVNVPPLMKDLLESNPIAAFVNSHPHDDHLRGIVELSDTLDIDEVWHSGHVPGKKHRDAYEDLKKVIQKVKDAGGDEIVLEGSREAKKFGEAEYYNLAPAEYVTDEIEDEDPESRYRRIHEQCVVLKFGTGDSWIMLPGDADRDAFEKHITNYHKERLRAVVLAGSHHGSRTFFKYSEGDDPYLDALAAIAPEYVVISAPKATKAATDTPMKTLLNSTQRK